MTGRGTSPVRAPGAGLRPTSERHGTSAVVRLGALVALLMAVGGGLSACTDAEAKPRPTASHTATRPTPTPEPSESTPQPVPSPTVPDAMSQPGEAGATAAATYFLSLYTYLFESGDATAWNALSDPGCGFCADTASSATSLHDDGWTVQGGTFDIVASSAVTGATDLFKVDVEVRHEATVLVRADGSSPQTEDAEHLRMTFVVIGSPGAWVIRAVEHEIVVP